MKPIIQATNVGKKYAITHERGGYITLRESLTNVISSPLSFAKHRTKRVMGLEKKEDFWALRDISFEIGKGELVGIIGPNGSGKSTLLKILSQITPPTEGQITLRGKVGSLLEVGTGFHPELTGRENIFLNGAILGMTRRTIASKFDEIVAFAEVEKFLDTPVKRFSSGMYVRLAFSVAAHMDPDILVVDEVLAVGDLEFQKKCLGKMAEVNSEQGRTILFVSHNMAAVEQLCPKAILLNHGRIVEFGPTKDVVQKYINKEAGESLAVLEYKPYPSHPVAVTKIIIRNDTGKPSARLDASKPFNIEIHYTVIEPTRGAMVGVHIYTSTGVHLLESNPSDWEEQPTETLTPGEYVSTITVPGKLFNAGNYLFDAVAHIPTITTIDGYRGISFSLFDNGSFGFQQHGGAPLAILAIPFKHTIVKTS